MFKPLAYINLDQIRQPQLWVELQLQWMGVEISSCFLSITTSHMFDDELETEVTALKTSVISDPYDANRVLGCPKCSQVSFTLFLFMAPEYFPHTWSDWSILLYPDGKDFSPLSCTDGVGGGGGLRAAPISFQEILCKSLENLMYNFKSQTDCSVFTWILDVCHIPPESCCCCMQAIFRI